MKRIITSVSVSALLLAALPAFCGTAADSAYTIHGYLPGQTTGKMMLRYSRGRASIMDSAMINNGHFEFKGFISQPVEASIYKAEKNNPFGSSARFYLEPGSITVTAFKSIGDAVVQGGQTQSEYALWTKLSAPFSERSNDLMRKKYEHRDNKDSVAAFTIRSRQVSKERIAVEQQFISSFPDSYVSWNLVQNNGIAINPDILSPEWAAIHPRFKATPEGREIARKLEIAKRTWIGSPAIEFSQPDVNGKQVSLASFRGQYVLVDFWASWCGPCRMENPSVLKAYDAYKDKGFTVLGVSMDDEKGRDKWIKAIADDKMPWLQVSDLKGMRDNQPANLYGIRAIPQNFLVDPNGIIVAKNLRGDDLYVTLGEILNKKK